MLTYSFDSTADAAYLAVRQGPAMSTVEAVPGRVMLDYDERGRLVGIEVLNVSEAA